MAMRDPVITMFVSSGAPNSIAMSDARINHALFEIRLKLCAMSSGVGYSASPTAADTG